MLAQDVVTLIREIANKNPRWGAPRIHGELLKLGIEVSQTSVAKYMKRTRWTRPTSQKWNTFVRNHSKDIVAIDFFALPSLWFQQLWVLVIMAHDRRKILRFAVTKKPSHEWTTQQIRNAYPYKEMHKIIIHDRDRNFWGIKFTGFREIVTAHKCPWQNGYVERVIGSVRRECTDHLIVISERQVQSILEDYREYYNKSRTHLSLNKDSPIHRKQRKRGRIVCIPKVGGLHYEFRRVAA